MTSTAQWIDKDVEFIRGRYNRLAKLFLLFELMFLLPLGIRKRAVACLRLEPGGRVLEVGCGTGRNLRVLVNVVGPEGHVYGVDNSRGMLAVAERQCAAAGYGNVTLACEDAAVWTPPGEVDAVLFSLSYAVMPHHREVLQHVWNHLRPGGRLVIMDARLPANTLGKLLRPFVLWISRATVLGNPDIQPWRELAELTPDVEYEELQFGSYYIVTGTKPGRHTVNAIG